MRQANLFYGNWQGLFKKDAAPLQVYLYEVNMLEKKSGLPQKFHFFFLVKQEVKSHQILPKIPTDQNIQKYKNIT